MKHRGTLLKSVRHLLGMEQDEFAERLKISRSYLSNLETGNREVTAGKVSRWAQDLGVSDEELDRLSASIELDSTPQPPPPDSPAMERVAAALERIADAIEKPV